MNFSRNTPGNFVQPNVLPNSPENPISDLGNKIGKFFDQNPHLKNTPQHTKVLSILDRLQNPEKSIQLPTSVVSVVLGELERLFDNLKSSSSRAAIQALDPSKS